MTSKQTASVLLTCSGALMTVSGILMAVCVRLEYGGILWAAASCMFFAAYHFLLAEKEVDKAEGTDDESKTV